VLSDWSISPLIRYSSGLPVNPSTGKDNSLTGGGNDRPNVVAGLDPYTGADHGLKYQYVNPAAYTANPIGTFGNAGHLSLRAPGSFNGMDAAVARQFKLRERLSIHFRAEAFNAFNHPRFNAPNTSISSSSFGQITSAAAPRILQGSMKLVF
jgi:hypothetical protein